MSVLAYTKQKCSGGWTRVDLLLYLYDRTITACEACERARSESDENAYAQHLIDVNKGIMALFVGLKPETDDVAFNVARLLHYVSEAVIRIDFATAIGTLASLRDGFAAVADEVNELEMSGEIPSMLPGKAFRV